MATCSTMGTTGKDVDGTGLAALDAALAESRAGYAALAARVQALEDREKERQLEHARNQAARVQTLKKVALGLGTALLGGTLTQAELRAALREALVSLLGP